MSRSFLTMRSFETSLTMFCLKNRHAHSDIPKVNFQEYRRKSLKEPNVSSMRSVDKRRTASYAMSFVAGVAAMYVLKSHTLHYVLFMSPSRELLAEAQVEISLKEIKEGKTAVVKWRGKPVFIYHRSPSIIEQEKAVDISTLRDPETDDQRAQRPEWLIIIGICTHLGCVPITNAGMITGGFYCPCHGSHFDGSGRIRKGPAPTNMEIPEYKFLSDDSVLIG